MGHHTDIPSWMQGESLQKEMGRGSSRGPAHLLRGKSGAGSEGAFGKPDIGILLRAQWGVFLEGLGMGMGEIR